MAVPLHFNIRKRLQVEIGQKFFPHYVCGEPEVFTLFCPNPKILNNKQKIFIKGQITLLIHLVDDPIINVPLAIFMDLWQFPFFACKTAQNGFSAFLHQLIKEDDKF